MSSLIRRPSKIDFSGVQSLTQQSSKDECDIHTILRKAAKSGIFPAPVQARYGNGVLPDFQQAQNVIAYAQQGFEALPSRLRDRFRNDVANFYDFCADPENRDQMVKLGISTDHLPAVEVPSTAAVAPVQAPAATEVAPAAKQA